MIINFDSVKSKKFPFILTGPNWDKGTNYIHIKRIEILSNSLKYSKGVFATLVGSNGLNNPHNCNVLISSTNYGFNSFHLLHPNCNISTLNKENSWFQIELTQGYALFTSFRLKRGEIYKLKSFKLVCSNDIDKPIEKWLKLIEINEKEENEYKLTDIYKFKEPSPPVKYVRLIQTTPNWSNNSFLKFWHFDLFGYYFS